MRKITSYLDLMYDFYIDRRLGITTRGQRKTKEHDNIINFMYEPSPYRNLNKIFSMCEIRSEDHFVDFGCGKGRVLVTAALNGCKNLYGVDLSQELIDIARENLEQCKKRQKHINYDLQCIDAKRYRFNHHINWVFFYNPFQLKVFIYVFKALLRSIEEKPRRVTICFTEAKDSVIEYFESLKRFTCVHKDSKERVYMYVYEPRDTILMKRIGNGHENINN